MKKLILSLLLAMFVISLNAQEKGKIRVGGNLGLSFPSRGGGLSIDLLDVRYNILNNLNAGVKFGGAFMIRDMAELDQNKGEATLHMSSNFMLVGDYYFNKGKSLFAPFIGGGVGSFSIYDLYMQIEEGEEYNYQYDELPNSSKALGGALRAGFELGKFRMALEYYIIPQTKMYDVKNIMQVAGTSENNYLSLNMGFYFGGGRWKK